MNYLVLLGELVDLFEVVNEFCMVGFGGLQVVFQPLFAQQTGLGDVEARHLGPPCFHLLLLMWIVQILAAVGFVVNLDRKRRQQRSRNRPCSVLATKQREKQRDLTSLGGRNCGKDFFVVSKDIC
jgi:hypothetical protein